MKLPIEFEIENDGRWIAEITALPGVMAYGKTREEAERNVEALALRVFADRLENGEKIPDVSAQDKSELGVGAQEPGSDR